MIYCITMFISLVALSVASFAMYKLYARYADSLELYEVHLKEFKESPISRKVVMNLPKMDIIKEEPDDDDEKDLFMSEG